MSSPSSADIAAAIQNHATSSAEATRAYLDAAKKHHELVQEYVRATVGEVFDVRPEECRVIAVDARTNPPAEVRKKLEAILASGKGVTGIVFDPSTFTIFIHLAK